MLQHNLPVTYVATQSSSNLCCNNIALLFIKSTEVGAAKSEAAKVRIFYLNYNSIIAGNLEANVSNIELLTFKKMSEFLFSDYFLCFLFC